MLIYKLKQNSKQQTGLNYVIYVEMTNLKFSLTSQCHETAIRKKLSGQVLSNSQSMKAHVD